MINTRDRSSGLTILPSTPTHQGVLLLLHTKTQSSIKLYELAFHDNSSMSPWTWLSRI